MLSLLLGPTLVSAQERMTLGLGLGLWQQPVETDFSKEGTALDLFFDYEPWYLRIGVNQNAATADDTITAGDLSYNLGNQAVYLAARYPYNLGNLDLYGLLGVASISAKLEESSIPLNNSASASGYMLGAGAVYYLGNFGLGLQYALFNATADLSTDINVGSNQVQALATYSF